MKINTSYLKKYVKHLFGLDIEFKIVKRIRRNNYEYVGWAESKWNSDGRWEHTIRITEKVIQNKLPQWLIWHEVGHIDDEEGEALTEREYNAEKFALGQANKRGYYRILQEMVDLIEGASKRRKETRYRRARNLLFE